MAMKPEAVLEWIKTNGVGAAGWTYGKDRGGYAVYRYGPTGISLTPINGGESKAIFVPLSTWMFIKRRIQVTPRHKPSMFAVA